MRTARIRGIGEHHVHVMSRIVQRQFLLKELEKEKLRDLLLSHARFSGLTVISWTVLDNHYHALVRQPDPEQVPDLTIETLFSRLPHIYSEEKVRSIRKRFDQALENNNQEWIERELAGYAKRMHDVSFYQKEVKQRFSQWYNLRNDRRGTLWEERYKSVLVEGSEEALMTMAAYIDLNAVRAGIVERVEDYRWCSYAMAVAGDQEARAGIGSMLDSSAHISGEAFRGDWEQTSKLYRLWLYSEGLEKKPNPETGSQGRRGFSHEELSEVERVEGKMPRSRALHCRVRYFTDGAVLGSRAFVEEIFHHNRSHFGKKRETGARPMLGAEWGGLCVARDLRKTVMSVPK